MALIIGIAKWAYVTQPSTRFDPEYTVSLIVDDEIAKDFQARGFRVKREAEGMAVIFKRKVDGPNGRVRPAPKLYDKDKKEIDTLIGNGSKVKIQYNEYQGKSQYGPYSGLDLQAVQILELKAPSAYEDGEEILSDDD